MTIEELRNKHFNTSIAGKVLNGSTDYKHTKLSIQFAIDVLEKFEICNSLGELPDVIEDKIQELKQYLDERDTN